ncbi:cyclin [Hamiltosporidium tvaerminnensis]|uniref:Cyclin n=2 Tax=Hamiltosporidium TaxID=1176354 RepID=A0A4Q9LCZ4_9MICR|nr:cyclin [Hamiltosporidium tvaerminnensis]TBU02011.1 cyclin [Hamiltosporidium magnivora]TBU05757.1 cyclin [Hamiltosporidium tvaerminnensis]
MKRLFQDITNVIKKNIKLTIHRNNHRKKLIQWLYEVCTEFSYSPITYTLCVQILDKYTSLTPINYKIYQLIGITCLFISAKIEESTTKDIHEYITVTDNSVSLQQILNTEKDILCNLNFNLFFISPHSYINIFYLENISYKYNISIEHTSHLLHCFVASVMEKEEVNMYWLYEEAKTLFEKCLEKKEIDKEIRLYIPLYNKDIIKG